METVESRGLTVAKADMERFADALQAYSQRAREASERIAEAVKVDTNVGHLGEFLEPVSEFFHELGCTLDWTEGEQAFKSPAVASEAEGAP